MKVYKATDKDMKCRRFQYELGKAAEVKGNIELYKNGLHACEMPLDVLGYYAPGNGSRYFEAELEDVSDDKLSLDTNRVGKRLTLSVEIGISGLVMAQVEYVKAQCGFDNAIKKVNGEKENHATGDKGAASATGAMGAASATGWGGVASATGASGAASATGWGGAASSTGDKGAASATGDKGAASATGWGGVASATGLCGAASATGSRGAASATGDQGVASSTGDQGVASATGMRGAASATGARGAASATGWCGAASAIGKGCVAIATGCYGRVMGEIGNAVVCVERNDNGDITSIMSAIVDGESLKPGVWYTVKNGEWRRC